MLSSLGQRINVAVIGSSGAIGHAILSHLEVLPSVDRVYSLSRSGIHEHGSGEHSAKTVPLPVDLLQEASLAQAVSQIDVPLSLIFVATGILHEGSGLKPEKSIKDFQSDHFAKVFAVNTTGPAMVAKYLLPKMVRHQKNVFSVVSARVGSIGDNQLGGWYAYRASKAALNMIIKTLAIETGRRNKESVVVSLHPGTVDSQLSQPFQSSVPEGQLFSPEHTAEKLLDVIDRLTPKESGSFFAYDGEKLPF